jgi:hypothetical protein
LVETVVVALVLPDLVVTVFVEEVVDRSAAIAGPASTVSAAAVAMSALILSSSSLRNTGWLVQ